MLFCDMAKPMITARRILSQGDVGICTIEHDASVFRRVEGRLADCRGRSEQRIQIASSDTSTQ
jgi:hypothetical protein